MRIVWKLLIFWIAISLAAQLEAAAQTPIKIDFEDLPNAPTAIAGTYKDRGINFMAAVGLNLPDIARSGSRAIVPCHPSAPCDTPIEIGFAAGQTRVSVWVGHLGPLATTQTVSVHALSEAGTIEDVVHAKIGPHPRMLPITVPLEVNSTRGAIRRVEVSFSPDNLPTTGLSIDDLEFLPAPAIQTMPFSYEIDSTVVPSIVEVIGVDGSPNEAVGVALGANGLRDEYVQTEVVFHPSSASDLESFLARYEGSVLRDGSPILIPDAPQREPIPSTGWYLIRVNLERSALDDFITNSEAAGLAGHFRFSSEDAARLAALVVREHDGAVVGPSLVFKESSFEHPDDFGGNIDWSKWWWMTEDDDSSTAAVDGLSIGVTRAWNYLLYQGRPPVGGGTWTPPIVAVVDRGFDLDENTGVPLNGNLDYFYLGAAPLQGDVLDQDGRAGGPNGNSNLSWHGQGAFGVCCAYPGNGFGGAGTGGQIARPMLIRTGGRRYTTGSAVWSAAVNGADVITISAGGECGHLCRSFAGRLLQEQLDDMLTMAVKLASTYGAIVVAAAGNDQTDLSEFVEFAPCELHRVICVGAIDQNGQKVGYSNWGNNVDIWAPTGTVSTVTPASALIDADDIGIDELTAFHGTSASTPFIAGIVALMKALDPTLRWDDIQSILQATSNGSTDPKVKPGYVDAFRAVEGVTGNRLPAMGITKPNKPAGSYARVYYLDSDWSDPEPGALLARFQDERKVEFSSDRDGYLCTATAAFLDDIQLGCQLATPLSLGPHLITARGIDPFGAETTDTRAITITNQPPIADITRPADGVTLRDNQIIRASVTVIDPDVHVPQSNVIWSSSIANLLTAGTTVKLQPLPEGQHTITVTATDALGLQMQDSILIHVVSAAGFPSAEILDLPAGASRFLAPGESLALEGRSIDAEEGSLSGSQLEWISSRDGWLASGNEIVTTLSGPDVPCNPESVRHTITLRATDSDGHVATDELEFSVGRIC